MTKAAVAYWHQCKDVAIPDGDLLRFPDNSLFEKDGRIVTFIGRENYALTEKYLKKKEPGPSK